MSLGALVKYRDLAIAFLLLLCGVGGFLSAYALLLERNAAGFQFSNFGAGDTNYAIFGRGECIGGMSVNFKPDAEQPSLDVEGNLRVRVGNWHPNLRFTSEAYFNSVGQLGGSITRVYIDKNTLMLGTTGVAPLSIKIKGRLGPRKVEQEFEVEGPFELVKLGENSYRFKYEHLPRAARDQVELMEQPLIKDLNIEVLETGEDDSACDSSGAELDLTQVISLLRSLTVSFQNSIAGGLLKPDIDSGRRNQ
jgi:hypothetical protein